MERAIIRGFCQACLPCGLPSLAYGADGEDLKRGGIWRFEALLVFWFEHSRAREPVVDSAGVPATEPSRVAELKGELFCTEFGHRVKIDSLDDHILSSSRRERPCPFEVPSVADVQAALEPLTRLLKMEKATGPFIPNEILRGAGQNFIAVFADLVVRVLREGAPKSWRVVR